MKVSRPFESYSKPLASALLCYQIVASLLYSFCISQSYVSVIASQYIGTRVSLFFLSIALLLYILLLRYSSFLLSVSALVFSTPLIYKILKLQVAKVSAYQTCLLFSSLVVVKQIRFLQSIRTYTQCFTPSKQTLYSYSALTITSSSLSQILQFNSTSNSFREQYIFSCYFPDSPFQLSTTLIA